LPTSNPTMMNISYPTVAVVTNCDRYLMYHELPSNWCDSLMSWAICGIADGVIYGSNWGCEFRSNQTGVCNIDGNDQCTQFLRESDIESADPENRNIVLIVLVLVFGCYLLCCCWKMTRKKNRRNQQDDAVEQGPQQRIEYREAAYSPGISVIQQQSLEGVVEIVEPTKGDEIVNSMHPEGRPVWSSSNFVHSVDRRSLNFGENQPGEDLAPPDYATPGYTAPPPDYELSPPNYEAPPPYYESV